MSKNSVEISGFKEVAKTLAVLPEKYFDVDGKQGILGKAANPIQNAIRNRVPVGKLAKHSSLDGVKRRGTLQRSVQVFSSRKKRGKGTILVGNVLNKNSRISKVKGAKEKLSKARNKRAYYASILLAINKRSWTPYGGRRGQRTKPALDFISKGYQSSKVQAQTIIIREGNRVISKYKRRFGF